MTGSPGMAPIPSLATVVATTGFCMAMNSISLFCMPAPACTGSMQTAARAMWAAGSATSPVTVMPSWRASARTSGRGSRPTMASDARGSACLTSGQTCSTNQVMAWMLV